MSSAKDEKYKILDLPFSPYETSDAQKKCLIPYQKLVVPVRMRSVYWKYFGFPADEDGSIITKDRIVCIACKNQMINNHNTSNLRMHIYSKHKSIMAKIDPAALLQPMRPSKKRKSTIADGLEVINAGRSQKNGTAEKVHVVLEESNDHDISNISIILPDAAEEYPSRRKKEPLESNEMTDSVVNFIISDLLSPDVVDGSGFRCLMSSLSDRVRIPNKKKVVSEIIPTLFNSSKEQLYNSMRSSSVSSLSLSMEEWRCSNCVKCISIYAHFTQNATAALQTRLLRTVSFTGSETESYWTGILDRLFREWLIDVNSMTAVIVAFDNEVLLKAIKAKHLLTVPCFMFVIQRMCDKFCFHHRQIEPVLEKCRKLVEYFHESRLECQEHFITSDHENCEEVDDDGFELSSGPDRRGLWLTTYVMLKSLIYRRNSIEEAVLDLDQELLHIIPSEEEWKIIVDVASLLEPLKTILITLFEEKNSLISLLKPLMWKVCSSKLESSDEDSELIEELKKQIQRALNDAYDEQEVSILTQIATLLDPRFKHFIVQEDKIDIEATLVELLTNFVNVEGSASPKQSSEDGTPKKTSRLSGINSLLGNIFAPKSTMTRQDKIKAEVNQYQSQISAALEQCPLEWWSNMNHKCPNLSRLAYRYHCIPAVVIHAANHSVHDYMKFHQKRSILNVEIADALLFLHINKNLS